ncbi:hypothetical protein H9P43_006027 [Blastocladiella emersonii ATCC 22665]|nr:hypothetical protein H9P43_006005 [Blastocladiella emersonii ATCC 22665]KAI9175663.1 hypothetical protein H9P43_006027 [Blastocladiella emersonii ATCC 22665]
MLASPLLELGALLGDFSRLAAAQHADAAATAPHADLVDPVLGHDPPRPHRLTATKERIAFASEPGLSLLRGADGAGSHAPPLHGHDAPRPQTAAPAATSAPSTDSVAEIRSRESAAAPRVASPARHHLAQSHVHSLGPLGDGQVSIRFSNGATYTGPLANGEMHGLDAIYTWHPSGTRFAGQFLRNRIHGEGRFEWADGSTYRGEVQNNVRSGKGEITLSTGVRYTGTWLDGRPHGTGRMVYSDTPLSFYDGDFVHGQRHGHGTMRYPSGAQYTGAWAGGERHGQGTMVWAAAEYSGAWEHGRMHGRGRYLWKLDQRQQLLLPSGKSGGSTSGPAAARRGSSSSSTDSSQVEDDVPGKLQVFPRASAGSPHHHHSHSHSPSPRHHGHGHWHSHGSRTNDLGEEDDSSSSSGGGAMRAQYSCRNWYEGDFVANQRHGRGVLHYADGSEYAGEFVANKKHGAAVYRDRYGRVYRGPWVNDRMAEPFPDAAGGGVPDFQLPYADRDALSSMVRRHLPLLTRRFAQYASLAPDLLNSATLPCGLSRSQWWALLADAGIRRHRVSLAAVDALVDALLDRPDYPRTRDHNHDNHDETGKCVRACPAAVPTRSLHFFDYLCCLIEVATFLYAPDTPGVGGGALGSRISLQSPTDDILEAYRAACHRAPNEGWHVRPRRTHAAFWSVLGDFCPLVDALYALRADWDVARVLHLLHLAGELAPRDLGTVVHTLAECIPWLTADAAVYLEYPLVPLEMAEVLFETFAVSAFFPAPPPTPRGSALLPGASGPRPQRPWTNSGRASASHVSHSALSHGSTSAQATRAHGGGIARGAAHHGSRGHTAGSATTTASTADSSRATTRPHTAAADSAIAAPQSDEVGGARHNSLPAAASTTTSVQVGSTPPNGAPVPPKRVAVLAAGGSNATRRASSTSLAVVSPQAGKPSGSLATSQPSCGSIAGGLADSVPSRISPVSGSSGDSGPAAGLTLPRRGSRSARESMAGGLTADAPEVVPDADVSVSLPVFTSPTLGSERGVAAGPKRPIDLAAHVRARLKVFAAKSDQFTRLVAQLGR